MFIYHNTVNFILKYNIRLKGSNQIETDSEEPHHIEVSGNTLTINRAVESDAGEYTCQLLNAENKNSLSQKDFKVVCMYIIFFNQILFFFTYLTSIQHET